MEAISTLVAQMGKRIMLNIEYTVPQSEVKRIFKQALPNDRYAYPIRVQFIQSWASRKTLCKDLMDGKTVKLPAQVFERDRQKIDEGTQLASKALSEGVPTAPKAMRVQQYAESGYPANPTARRRTSADFGSAYYGQRFQRTSPPIQNTALSTSTGTAVLHPIDGNGLIWGPSQGNKAEDWSRNSTYFLFLLHHAASPRLCILDFSSVP